MPIDWNDPDTYELPPDLNLEATDFSKLKTWLKAHWNDPEPDEPALETSVRAMLRRWGVPPGWAKYESTVGIFMRLHDARLKGKVSRVFWAVFRHNAKRLLGQL